MSELVIIGFDQKFKADEVMLSLLKLEQDYLVDLEDAVVVTKNSAGKIRIKPYYDLIAGGGLSSNFWGKFITALMSEPATETLAEIGIDEKFCQEVEKAMPSGSSAIFILVRNAEPDKVLQELYKFKGKVLRTSLSKENEAKIQEALS
ncbi:MAG: DUF1269 domain-containing protein [Xenococcaceae cyanobacterium]